MKNVAFDAAKSSTGLKHANNALKNYVLNPIKLGIFGFMAFFSILLVTKIVSYWIGTYEDFSIDLNDALLSAVGFILVFLIKFLENFKEDDD